jgi:inorganic pyrophosphatase
MPGEPPDARRLAFAYIGEREEMMSKTANVLTNPTSLQPLDDDDDFTIQVIVETPKGSRNKYAFDAEQKVFTLKKVLPAGMTFPYDFGFVPSTEADDGDPLDVLILMDEPAYPGVVVKCRIVGVIEGEQGNGKKTLRNDRVIAAEVANHQWSHVKHIDDLQEQFIEELSEFFVNYHKLQGKEYRVLDVKGRGAGRKCVQQAMKEAKKS